MGSQMLAIVESDDRQAAERLANVPRWFEAWEEKLSRFRNDSELSRLNRSAGRDVPVSPVLWDVIDAAIEAARATRGIVRPTVLEAMVAAGYDRTWESIRSGPAAGVAEASPAPDWRRIERNPESHSVRLPEGVSLDLGGIGKGWAADRAARRLRRLSPALVDAGGDIAVSGPMAGGEPWPIGVADPRREGEIIGLLEIRCGGVATSGRDQKRWRQGDVWRHHLIDPRTGLPAETDVLTATAVARTAQEAEMAAKTVAILGQRDGLLWIEARPSMGALIVLDDGRVVTSRRMKPYLGG
jgi:thiamine biosynthesis lipoprotein